MEGLGRIIIEQVNDDGGDCLGVEIMYGPKRIAIDRLTNSIQSSPFDSALDRTSIFDTNIHCKQTETSNAKNHDHRRVDVVPASDE